MSENSKVTLPVTGMTCANCVLTVERNLKKIDGVNTAVVNLTTERATVDFDPGKTEIEVLVNKINRAGYGVLTAIVEFSIPQMSDDNDARRIENELSRENGIAACTVNFASQKVKSRIHTNHNFDTSD